MPGQLGNSGGMISQQAGSGFMPMPNGNGLGNGMVPVNPGSGMPNNSPLMNMNKPAGMPGEWAAVVCPLGARTRV